MCTVDTAFGRPVADRMRQTHRALSELGDRHMRLRKLVPGTLYGPAGNAMAAAEMGT